MKTILELMAAYNKAANDELYEILDKADPELLTRSHNTYYDSVLGLLNHVLLADLGWLSRFRDSNLDLPSLRSPVIEFEHPGGQHISHDNWSDLSGHRVKTDDLFVAFIEETPQALFEGEIEVPRRDKTRVFPFGKIVMHVFNHQTHHRGAVSTILDQNGIENDYSNVLNLLV